MSVMMKPNFNTEARSLPIKGEKDTNLFSVARALRSMQWVAMMIGSVIKLEEQWKKGVGGGWKGGCCRTISQVRPVQVNRLNSSNYQPVSGPIANINTIHALPTDTRKPELCLVDTQISRTRPRIRRNC